MSSGPRNDTSPVRDKGGPVSRRIRSRFFPDLIVASPARIDYPLLVSRGYQVALVDIDNTLACHGSRVCDQEAENIIACIQEAGLTPLVASNAPAERARTFADSLGVSFIAKAGKPKTREILRALDQKGYDACRTLMIGDQLLTDAWSARRAGIAAILTDRRSPKEIWTVRLKRPLEWILIRLGGKAFWQSLRDDYSRLPACGGSPHDRL